MLSFYGRCSVLVALLRLLPLVKGPCIHLDLCFPDRVNQLLLFYFPFDQCLQVCSHSSQMSHREIILFRCLHWGRLHRWECIFLSFITSQNFDKNLDCFDYGLWLLCEQLDSQIFPIIIHYFMAPYHNFSTFQICHSGSMASYSLALPDRSSLDWKYFWLAVPFPSCSDSS